MAEQTTQIVREAPEIEAIKLALLKDARELSKRGRVIPPQLVADMSGLQVTAAELAAAGIGGYQPYLQEAGYALGDAQTAIGDVMQTGRLFNVRRQTLYVEALRAFLPKLPQRSRV